MEKNGNKKTELKLQKKYILSIDRLRGLGCRQLWSLAVRRPVHPAVQPRSRRRPRLRGRLRSVFGAAAWSPGRELRGPAGGRGTYVKIKCKLTSTE